MSDRGIRREAGEGRRVDLENDPVLEHLLDPRAMLQRGIRGRTIHDHLNRLGGRARQTLLEIPGELRPVARGL